MKIFAIKISISLLCFFSYCFAFAQGDLSQEVSNLNVNTVNSNQISISWTGIDDTMLPLTHTLAGYIVFISETTVAFDTPPTGVNPTLTSSIDLTTATQGIFYFSTNPTATNKSYSGFTLRAATAYKVKVEPYYTTTSNSFVRSTATSHPTSNGTTFSIQPTASLSNLIFSNIQTNSITLSFANSLSNTSGYLVLASSNSASINGYTPPNGVLPQQSTEVGIAGSSDNDITVLSASSNLVNIVHAPLSSSTTYYYKIYAYNGSGLTTHYSTTPLSGNQQTACNYPLQQHAFNGVITTTANSATLNWDNSTTTGIGDRVIITAVVYNSTTLNETTPTSSISYENTARNNFSTAPLIIGSPATKVVYAGDATTQTVTITGLNTTTTMYRFRIYGYNSGGFCYNNSMNENNKRESTISTLTLSDNNTSSVVATTTNIGPNKSDVVLFSFKLNNTSSTSTNVEQFDIISDKILNSSYIATTSLYRSSANDNIGVPIATVTPSFIIPNNNKLSFSLPASSETLAPSTDYYYYVVIGSGSSWTSNLDITFSINPSNITLSNTANYINGVTITGTTYTFDATNPTITKIEYSKNTISTAPDQQTQTVTIYFSEPVSTTVSPSISFTASSSTSSLFVNHFGIATPTVATDGYAMTPTAYQQTYQHDRTEQVATDVKATIANLSSITDLAGNTLEMSMTNTNTGFDIDTERPRLTTINLPSGYISKSSLTLNVELIFSEDINLNSVTSAFTSSTNFTETSREKTGNGTYEFVFTHNGTAETITSQNITFSDISDQAGNSSQQNQNDRTGNFKIDTKSPSVTSIMYGEKNAFKGGEDIVFTIETDETTINPPTITLAIQGIPTEEIVSAASTTLTPGTTTYQYTHTVDATSNGKVIVTIAGEDEAGNTLIMGTQPPLIIDNFGPSISNFSPVDDTHNVPLDGGITLEVYDRLSTYTIQAGKKITLYKVNDKNNFLNNPTSIDLPHPSTVPTYLANLADDPTNSSTTITIPFTGNFESGAIYYIEIEAGFFIDNLGNESSASLIDRAMAPITENNINESSKWNFSTYAPPEITSINYPQDKTAACIGENIEIIGKYLTGVQTVYFHATQAGEGVAINNDGINIMGDTLIQVTVPATVATIPPDDNRKGKIYIEKPNLSMIPSTVMVGIGYQTPLNVGINRANLALMSGETIYHCDEGAKTEVKVQIEVTGGSSADISNQTYSITYNIEETSGGVIVQTINKVNIGNSQDFGVGEIQKGKTQMIRLTKVTDSYNCSAESYMGAGVTGGGIIATKNIRQKVDAGGENGKVSLCLPGSERTIDLRNIAQIKNLPSTSNIEDMVEWTFGPYATPISSTLLKPTIEITNTALRQTNGFPLTLKTTNPPLGCEAASDIITITITSDVVINAGAAPNGTITKCWSGNVSDVVEIALQGSISGANKAKWSSIGESGTFSPAEATSLSSTTYTLSTAEKIAGQTTLVLTATDLVCVSSSMETTYTDTLKINLETLLPPNSFKEAPPIKTCENAVTSYEISSPETGVTYEWSFKKDPSSTGILAKTSQTGATLTSTSGNATMVTWGDFTNMDIVPSKKDTLQIRAVKGTCRSNFTIMPITIYQTDSVTLSTPSTKFVDAYSQFDEEKNQAIPTQRIELGATVQDSQGNNIYVYGPDEIKSTKYTLVFSDEYGGVQKITNKNNPDEVTGYNYYPSLVVNNNNERLPFKTTIIIAYTNNETSCSRRITYPLTLYNGGQAFVLYKTKNENGVIKGTKEKARINSATNNFEACENDDPLWVKFDAQFLDGITIEETNAFKGFTLHPEDFPDDLQIEIREGGQSINRALQINPLSAGSPLSEGIRDPEVLKELSAILYPDSSRFIQNKLISSGSLGDLTEPKTEIEIRGWTQAYNRTNSMFEISESPEVYGRGLIKIYPNTPTALDIPELVTNGNEKIIEVCSNGKPINLRKVERENPGINYTFEATKKDGTSANDIITEPVTGAYELNPSEHSFETDKEVDTLFLHYKYTDANQCTSRDTVMLVITKTPESPQFENGSNICVTKGKAVPATLVNGTSTSRLRWFRNNPGIINNLDTNDPLTNITVNDMSYTPDIDIVNPLINGAITLYAEKLNSSSDFCRSRATPVIFQVINMPPLTWDNSCAQKMTNFTINLQNLAGITLVDWKIDDKLIKRTQGMPTLSNDELEITLNQKPDNYRINVKVTNSSSSCVADSTYSVHMLPLEILDIGDAYDAKDTERNFYATTDSESEKQSSWAYGTPNGAIIRNTANNNGSAWATNLSGNYEGGERSYLYTSCIDFAANYEAPILSFSSWIHTDDRKNDGVILQYSRDGKALSDPTKVWSSVGSTNSGGSNWYNEQLLSSLPGGIANQNYGWNGSSKGWRISRHILDDIINNNATSVIFRFAFASQSQAESYEGFAVNNFHIGSRTRVVLLERFVNKGLLASPEENMQINFVKTFMDQANNATKFNVINLNYNIGSEDPLARDNGVAPTGRSFFYNVPYEPYSLMDGENRGRYLSTWGQSTYDSITLVPSLAQIEINSNLNDNERSINVTVTVTATSKFSNNVKLHVVAVEQKILKDNLPLSYQEAIQSNETEFQYVVKNMLTSAEGMNINNLNNRESQTVTLEWTPNLLKLYGGENNLCMIAFLQDEETKAIYQSGIECNIPKPGVITGLLDIDGNETKVLFYPSPADDHLNISLHKPTQQDLFVKINTLSGQLTNTLIIPRGSARLTIDTKTLAEGIYLLNMYNSQGTTVTEKIIITHD